MNRFWKRKLPVALLALAMMLSLVPAAAAASADIRYEVEADDTVKFDPDDFEDYFDDEADDDDFYRMEFTDSENLDDCGYLYAYDYEEDEEVRLKESKLTDYWFYLDSDDDEDYLIEDLYFEAFDDADGETVTLEFTLHGEDDEEVDGVLEIEIDGGGSSNGSVKLTYKVDADDTVEFDPDDFEELFDDEVSNEDFYRMEFTDSDNLDDCGYLYAYDRKEGEEVRLRENNVDADWFYLSSKKSEEYLIKDLYFEAFDDAEGETVTLDFVLHGDDEEEVEGVLYIKIEDGSDSKDDDDDADITYTLDEDDEVTFKRDDFKKLFTKKYSNFFYVRFTDSENLDDCGYLTSCAYDEDDDDFYDKKFDEDDLADAYFYYNDGDVDDDGDSYTLDDLTFVSDEDTDGETVTLEFTLYGKNATQKVKGTLVIEIGDVDDDDKKDSDDADITYTLDEDDDVSFKKDDFKKLFTKKYSNFNYVRFTDSDNLDDCGYLTSCAYDEDDDDFYDKKLDEDDLDEAYFYYNDGDVDDDGDSFTLDDLTFVSDDDTDGEVVTLDFSLHGKNATQKVTGVLRIEIGDVKDKAETTKKDTETGDAEADILYFTTSNTNVQLKASDFDRYLKNSYPTSSLQYVKLAGIPTLGGLYYNYYGASAYGTSARTKLTAANCDDQPFYVSPSGSSQYALSELTYVPSGTNYCAQIPFTAYGSGNRSVTGSVLISVSMKTVSEVYGVIPKNTSVNFPAPSIVAAVTAGTSTGLSSIQLLDLPSSKQGTVYVGSGTSYKADTETLYSYANSKTWQISQLRFVPASGYTGSVEIPYAACDSKGSPIAVGKFCLGVVPSAKKFSDITSSTWCYKYVTELASANVISGYTDGTYKPNNTVTYGAALKLVMLAAGYPEQAPTGSNVFSGYLDKARAEGIVTRSNVDLAKPITRLQIAQLAAGALKLDINNLSSIKPFTDTSDPYAQALNAAGIIEGYFANGTSTYKPNNTLTRGQLSAIVWRMQNYA